MTLQQRLGLRYAGIVAGCLALLAGLAHHEFVVEPHLRREMHVPELPETTWGEFAEVFFYGMIPVVLGGGWWFMRRSLRPINELARGVERIHADNLRERLPRTGTGDEVDRLTEVFNGMTARLDSSFQQIRQFTLHASHELKTPLTVLSVQLESALHQPPPDASTRAEQIHAMLDEVHRLSKIVESLTLLTKADSGMVAMDRSPLSLDELVRESQEDAAALADGRGIRVELGRCEPVGVTGDRHRLRQLLLNLADNAVKYCLPGGTVVLSLERAGGEAVVRITNPSEPLPPEILAGLFERFARGPNARAAGAEGSGLGLAIVRWIAEAHHGSVALSQAPSGTITATLTLPLAAATAR